MRDTDNALAWMLGLYVLSKYGWDQIVPTAKAATKATVKRAAAPVKAAPARQLKGMQEQGARLYDVVHADTGHVQDLPANPLSRQAVLDIAKRAGFPNPKLAAAIALAESGGVPNAMVRSSREYSVGLWQINTKAHPQVTPDDMKDARKNALAALLISKGGTNWKPWTSYANGKYRSFQTGVLAP